MASSLRWDERPDLQPHLHLAGSAFNDISADRPRGAMSGCGSIHWCAVERDATRYGTDAFERFGRLIRAQDRVYLEHLAAKAG